MRLKSILFGFLALSFQSSLAAGDLLVSSEGTNSVKRYDAVTGAYLGDFVTPGSGGLDRPQGISVGLDGNVYVSSVATGQVLRYNGTTGAFMGIFTQGPFLGFAADMDWHDGFLFVSDFQTNGYVNKYDGQSGAYLGRFTSDTYRGSDGIAWDAAGNMYVSSFGNNSIRRYGPTGMYLGDFVSGSSGGLAGPLDLRFGPDGNLTVNSFQNGTVKRYSGVTGAYMGDVVSGLGTTQGQAVGPDGALYVGSYSAGIIYRVGASGITPFANSGGLLRPNNFLFRPVPEPAAMTALGVGVALLVRRRRHPSLR